MTVTVNEAMEAFDHCLERHDLEGAMAVLDELKTGHAGTPPQAIKDKAITRIRTAYAHDPERLLETGLHLSYTASPGAREIGISLLPSFYASATAAIDERFIRVGNDDNWEVREWAASALAHVIGEHFDLVLPRLRQWAAHRFPNVRRMVAVATGYAMRDCDEGQCRLLLDVLTPLMADPDAYVGKNLGAFALGGYAIRYRAEFVAAWASSLDLEDERVAWNLATMFTTAEGAKRAPIFQSVLASLILDDRKVVRAAVSKALKNIARRNEPALTEILATGEALPDFRVAAGRARMTLG